MLNDKIRRLAAALLTTAATAQAAPLTPADLPPAARSQVPSQSPFSLPAPFRSGLAGLPPYMRPAGRDGLPHLAILNPKSDKRP